MRESNPSARRLAVTAALCLLVAASAASGQSGRKQKQSAPLPPVQGVPESKTKEAPPEPDPALEPPPQKDAGPPKNRLVIGSDTSSFDVSMFAMNVARQACVDEIRREVRSVNVQDGGSMHRSDAMKAAKNDDLTYVVLIEAGMMTASTREAEVRYTIFAPKTGKVRGTGMGNPVQYNTRMPRPPIAMSRQDYAYELCGRDVGQQVISRLGLAEVGRP
jgi:type IV secretory pathway VirB10-like protein